MLERFPLCSMIPASDVDRARKWYEEKLGLRPTMEDDIGLWYETGATRFAVYPSSFAGTARNTAAEWLIDDIEAAVADLRRRGVVFEDYDFPGLKTEGGIGALGAYRGAWFKDSEGNILALGQPPS